MMLYDLFDAQKHFLEPFADMALASAKFYTSKYFPLGDSEYLHRYAAACDLFYRLSKDYEKPEFGIKSVAIDGEEFAICEKAVLSKPFCDLLYFGRYSDSATRLNQISTHPVVLIVAPLSGHYATLLRDTVRTMLVDHSVYITDWRNARLVPLSQGNFSLANYVHYIIEFIKYIQDIHGNCHIMSVCQPTVPVLASMSLLASRGVKIPKSMVMMGGPIDARESPTAVNNLAIHHDIEWFEKNLIHKVPKDYPGAGRLVYPGFMQHAGFVSMNPDRHLDSHYDYFLNLVKGDEESTQAHIRFYDEYNAVLDMDAVYYLDTIKTVFQDFKLMNGTWDIESVDGVLERVKPQDIKSSALLTIEGELDDISGSGQTFAAHSLCTGIEHKKHIELKGAGHYGIFSGRLWRKILYPQVRDFIHGYN